MILKIELAEVVGKEVVVVLTVAWRDRQVRPRKPFKPQWYLYVPTVASIRKLWILSYITILDVFHMILTVNTDYFHKQCKAVGFPNGQRHNFRKATLQSIQEKFVHLEAP